MDDDVINTLEELHMVSQLIRVPGNMDVYVPDTRFPNKFSLVEDGTTAALANVENTGKSIIAITHNGFANPGKRASMNAPAPQINANNVKSTDNHDGYITMEFTDGSLMQITDLGKNHNRIRYAGTSDFQYKDYVGITGATGLNIWKLPTD